MGNKAEEILRDRERRHESILPYLKPGKVVVTIKANIPGPDKRLNLAYLIITYFAQKFSQMHASEKHRYDGPDGPEWIFVILANDASVVKSQAILLEEQNPYGRFVDIDVHMNAHKSLNRPHARACMLCGKDAFLCGRNQTHKLSDLLSYIQQTVYQNVHHDVMNAIDEAMMAELNLDPKFGLVTPSSSGSHPDMNYQLMLSAKAAIMPYFSEMFHLGWNSRDLSALFNGARMIGKNAETAMLAATNGVNAYKGLIFNLGMLVSALGYLLRERRGDLFRIVRLMAVEIQNDFEYAPKTSGLNAFHQYGIKGARGEAIEGFPTLKKLLPICTDLNRESLMKTLIEAIRMMDDTVLIKRAKTLQSANDIKTWFKSIDAKDDSGIKQLTARCITANLSFGGAADMLVLTVFYKLIDKIFAIEDYIEF